MTAGQLLQATRKLALLLELGFDLGEGLAGTPGMEAVREEVLSGASLVEALRRQGGPVNAFYLNTLEAALAGSCPAATVRRLADFLEAQQSVRRQMQAIAVYPALVLNLAMLQGVILLLVLLPTFPGLAWVSTLAPLPLLALIGCNLLLYREFRHGSLRLLPESARLLGLAEQSLWARAMATLLRAGLTLPQALKLASQQIQSRANRRQFQQLTEQQARGGELVDLVAALPGVDARLVWGLEAGSQGENLSDPLEQVADWLEQDVEIEAAAALKRLEPRLMFVVGVVVLGASLSVWMSLYGPDGVVWGLASGVGPGSVTR